MLIAIGSTNPVKVQAVEEVVRDYPQFAHAAFRSVSVPSEISEQPLSMEEIIRGAKNRAKNAFTSCEGCHYSFGIESGLFEAPGAQTGYLEACICCIYDGSNYHLGLSCGFEVPPKVLQHVLNDGMDLNQASNSAGISGNPKLGSAEGIIGILTKGRIQRKEYTKSCVTTAMIQLENADWYTPSVILS
ncbi:MAG: inosine/xanthosine triphosphatase [Verrucomicrobia bacterium]|nr:inosine/xanthosine triphosphatase [Verrucomicrobiota bacterium]